jgi:hypothetical protein
MDERDGAISPNTKARKAFVTATPLAYLERICAGIRVGEGADGLGTGGGDWAWARSARGSLMGHTSTGAALHPHQCDRRANQEGGK